MELRSRPSSRRSWTADDGRCAAVVTEDGERIDCQIVGLTAGVSARTSILSRARRSRPVAACSSTGACAPSVPDVFAAGDCAEIVTADGERNLIQQVWYTGKMQGERRRRGDGRRRSARYDPGIWFNSAKFLDLEYQTYGQVNMKVAGRGEPLLGARRRPARGAHRAHVEGGSSASTRWASAIATRCASAGCARSGTSTTSSTTSPRRNFDPEFFRRHEDEIAARLRGQVGELADDRRADARVRLRRGGRASASRAPEPRRRCPGCSGSAWRSSVVGLLSLAGAGLRRPRQRHLARPGFLVRRAVGGAAC